MRDTGKEVWAFTLPAPAASAGRRAAAGSSGAASRLRRLLAAPARRSGWSRCAAGWRTWWRRTWRRRWRLAADLVGGRGGGRGGGPTASQRGLSYWPGDATHGPRILFMGGNRLYAIDAANGQPSAGFGEDGSVLTTSEGKLARNGIVSYGGTPTIYRNVAIIGAATQEVPQDMPGNPRAFDIITGKKLWEFWTVAQPGQPGHDTWGQAESHNNSGWQNRSGANMWAFMAPVDAERGIVYLPDRQPGDELLRRRSSRATTPTAIRSSRSIFRPESICGTSRPCITTSGTRTCRRRARCSTSI